MKKKKRTAKIARQTHETNIRLELALDGTGNAKVRTGFGFLDHMLNLLARFSETNLTVQAKGDLEVDEHHLVEDAGICLGQALKEALGDKKGIARYGFAAPPMDETLVQVALDISGRPYLVFQVPRMKGRKGSFEIADTKEFLQALVTHAGITLHVNYISGENLHHVNEAVFKGLGLALKQAVAVTGRRLPSTKGRID